MTELTSMFTELIAEVLTVLIGAGIVFMGIKAKAYLGKLQAKDELGIIDIITDRMVEYAEAELKGKSGLEKRDFAVKKAVEVLKAKGIHVSEDEIIAGIENGVNKLKYGQLLAIDELTAINQLEQPDKNPEKK